MILPHRMRPSRQQFAAKLSGARNFSPGCGHTITFSGTREKHHTARKQLPRCDRRIHAASECERFDNWSQLMLRVIRFSENLRWI